MSILALIPARGGSKGIPQKNIVNFLGKPLLAHTAEAATLSNCFSKIVLSTDSEEIQKVGKKWNVACDSLRPSDLATDATPMIDVLLHAIQEHQLQDQDAICLLQPTSPLRNHKHIQEAVRLFESNAYDSVVSIMEVPHQFLPSSLLEMRGNSVSRKFPSEPKYTDRQSKPQLFVRNGPAILISRVSTLKKRDLYGDNVGGYFMDHKSSVDIDSVDDLALAEFYSKQGK
jgi:CMP-N,N'-diacetyllegionaminic acid synthase